MKWFGGFSGQARAPQVPVGAKQLWPHIADSWLLGDWSEHEVRSAHTGQRAVAVIGSCGAPAGELARLATHGVPDDITWCWPGSYVVVQVTAEATTLWTDVGGARPLYLLAEDSGIYWASSSRALAALTGHRLDLQRLAGSLLIPAIPEMLAERSMFAAVSLVPAGHRALLPASRPLELRRVWWPQLRVDDHAARLRRELAAAVAVRVDRAAVPTADLSGGYDSTALALLAAERLSPVRTVVGVTAHPEGITSGGDLTYARHAAERHPGILHRLMPLTAEQVPYSALESVPITDEPAPSTVAYARFAAQLRWMREAFGSDCHLTGDGGDGLLVAPPVMLAELVARRYYWRALAETIAWARLRRIAVWPLLRAAIRTSRTSRAAACYEVAQSLRAMSPDQRRSSPGGVASLLMSAADWATWQARELGASLAEERAVHLGNAAPAANTACVIAETMANVGRTARADVQLAEAHGIPLHNPFVDSRVIDTYLAVPLDDRPGPARFKPILKDAMRDLFPPALAARITKGTFTSDYFGGLRANLPTLLSLADGQLAAAGLVDPQQLRQTITRAATGVPDAYTNVAPVIAAEVWLRALDGAQPVAWEAAPDSQQAQPEGGAA